MNNLPIWRVKVVASQEREPLTREQRLSADPLDWDVPYGTTGLFGSVEEATEYALMAMLHGHRVEVTRIGVDE